MKGKYAARAENRRIADLSAELSTVRETLNNERQNASQRIKELESEVRRLHADHLSEASKLADKEVARRLEEAAEERRRRGLSDDILINFVIRNDRFMMNACRYVSMTKGIHPLDAIPMVTTWATDKEFYGVTDTTDFLAELGVPVDGWVATTWLKRSNRVLNGAVEIYERKRASRNVVAGSPDTITLDQAEAEGHPDIHPDYNPSWFGGGSSASRPRPAARKMPRVKAAEFARQVKGGSK